MVVQGAGRIRNMYHILTPRPAKMIIIFVIKLELSDCIAHNC